MKAIGIAHGLVVGTVLTVGCAERNTPTALPNHRGAAFAATALASAVNDSVGDVQNGVPGWQDIIQTSVVKKGQTFVLTMDLAADVPSTPPLPSGGTEAAHIWIWGFDTDPKTLQSGKDGAFPSGPGQATIYEYLATVEWDGTQFSGVLYNLTRDPMVVTPGQQFTVAGNRVTLNLGAGALGDPSTFTWNDATCTRHYDKFGSSGFQCFDFAPDNGLVTWPQ